MIVCRVFARAIVDRDIVVLLLVAGVAGYVNVDAPRVSASDGNATHDWTDVLQNFVDDEGRVDFSGLAADPVQLYRYVKHIYAVSPRPHPERFPTTEALLAYSINAYNALAICNVINSVLREPTDGKLQRFEFFLPEEVASRGRENLALRL